MVLDLIGSGIFLLVVTALVPPVGRYLARVFEHERTPLDRVLLPVERLIHRIGGVDPLLEMAWSAYARAMIVFTGVGTAILYAILRLQRFLPWSAHVSSPMSPLAGHFAAQKKRPTNAGTLRTDTALFSVFLVDVIFVVGALTYFPVLSLGPIAEAIAR